MSIVLAQVPVGAIALDERRFPDRDEAYVFDHLLRYCAKFEPLPAITVVIEGRAATVVRGHKYLAIAKLLGRPTIRAVVAPGSASEDVEAFLARDNVRTLSWPEIRASEDRVLDPMGWHVVYFERPLSREEKEEWDVLVARVLGASPGEVRVLHEDSGPLAEFQAATPVNDHAWAGAFMNGLMTFSRERVRIVSYQGTRLAPH